MKVTMEGIKLISNKARCKHCGDVIESKYTHDYQTCSCGAIAVDGGTEYLRRCFRTKPEDDFEDLSQVQGFGYLACWIDVKSALPDENEPVLVATKVKGSEEQPIFFAYREGWDGNTPLWYSTEDIEQQMTLNYLKLEVTHWMPLPEPPKEDE